MKQTLFAVYDLTVDAYAQPFTAPNINAGMRIFGDAATDNNTMMFKHPNDYSLVVLGEYDDATGIITPSKHGPSRIAGAKDFLRHQEQNNDLFEGAAVDRESTLVNGEVDHEEGARNDA